MGSIPAQMELGSTCTVLGAALGSKRRTTAPLVNALLHATFYMDAHMLQHRPLSHGTAALLAAGAITTTI